MNKRHRKLKRDMHLWIGTTKKSEKEFLEYFNKNDNGDENE